MDELNYKPNLTTVEILHQASEIIEYLCNAEIKWYLKIEDKYCLVYDGKIGS